MQNLKSFTVCVAVLSSIVVHAQKVSFTGVSTSIISNTATIPAGKKLFYTSGLTASAINSALPDTDYEKFGDTYTQAKNILEKFKVLLQAEGLTMADVFSMRVFVTPDSKTGKYDFDSWNKAYKEYFGNDTNPTKPVRATYGIATLVSPTRFIEIEIIAAFP